MSRIQNTGDTSLGKKAALIILLFVVVGIAVWWFTVGSTKIKVKSLLKEAEQSVSEENYEQAIFDYDEVLALDSQNLDARTGKLYAAELSGNNALIKTMLESLWTFTGDASYKEQLDERFPSVSEDTLAIAEPMTGSWNYNDIIHVYFNADEQILIYKDLNQTLTAEGDLKIEKASDNSVIVTVPDPETSFTLTSYPENSQILNIDGKPFTFVSKDDIYSE